MEKKKVILHFLRTGQYSGAENVAITIIEENQKRYGDKGIYVSISGPIDNVLKEHNIEHATVRNNSAAEYQRIIDTYKPNIIHAHDFGTSTVLAKTKSGAMYISHVHNNPPWIKRIGLKSIAFALASLKYKHILGVSESVFEEFIFNFVLRNKAIVISNPVNIQKIQKKANENDEKVISDVVFLGRLDEQKNPLRFIQIIKQCKKYKDDICAVMIGKGALKEQCEKEIEKLGLQNNVKMLGFKSNPYVYLKNSKILCLPSQWEGFGLVVIEAFSLGRPVIATPVGGMKNLVLDTTGILSNNDEEMVKEIIGLLNSNEYYTKKSIAALDRAEQLDNINQYIKRIHGIYYDEK